MNLRKLKLSDVFIKMLVYFLTASFALICILPVWHVLVSSFSDPIQLTMDQSFLFRPIGFSTESYELLFQYDNLWRSYLNTIFYTATSTVLGVFISLLAAYVLSRKKVLLNKFFTIFILITMLFSGGLIPFAVVVRTLGMQNSPLALIIPTCTNAMSIIILKNGIDSVPDEIFDAAYMDGAGHTRTLIQVVIPLTTSFIAVVALMNAIGQWNSWVTASLFISKSHQEWYPLQLVMRDILLNNSTLGVVSPSGYPITFYLEGLRAAAIIVAALPLIMLYPFLQKHFEKGIIIGGVKG